MIDDSYLCKLPEVAQSKNRENNRFLSRLRQLTPHDIDALFHAEHEEVFSYMDCMSCANCCRTTGPLLLPSDIKRLAKAMKLPEGEFYKRYVRKDEDHDYIFEAMPCPFLLDDNSCSVYAHRPTACREYPHTNRRKMYQILDLTMKNYAICPAVFDIIENIKASTQ